MKWKAFLLKNIAAQTGETINTLISRKRYAVLHLRERLLFKRRIIKLLNKNYERFGYYVVLEYFLSYGAISLFSFVVMSLWNTILVPVLHISIM